ncbi:MAG: RidA family protein [Proteobacteria bacterium]|jgi:enamine deaminase RidA (YjgF/YER057c/UK114 family)|nr:RidA family protein [Pseudomonadota bacterium]
MLTAPLAKYTHSRRVGSLLFIAGQGCRDPGTNSYAGVERDAHGIVVRHDIATQAAAVLHNIERVLHSHGLHRGHLVDVTVFLTDMAEFEVMNKVWNEFFREFAPPTRTTVAVTRLPGDNFIEMKAIAEINQTGV